MTAQNRGLWRNRDFLLVWGGQSISMFGSRVSYIAWMWWVWERTNSTAATAAIGIAAAIPNLLLGPVAGAMVDRFDRRTILCAMDWLNACIYAVAAFLLAFDRLGIWHVYILTALSATAMAFHRPSLQSSIPNLVKKDDLTQANSLYQISRGVCGLVGLLLGGILVASIGVAPTLWLDAGTFFLAGLSLLLVSFASPRVCRGEGWKAILRDTASGFAFLANRRSLFVLILLFALINFMLAPISVLFTVMSETIFHAGAKGLGMLSAAIASGLLAGGFLMVFLQKVRRRAIGIFLGLIAIGALLALFGLSSNLVLSLTLLAMLGVCVAVVNIFEAVIFQTRVPNELQGRVFAAQFALCEGLQPLSLAIGGALLTWISPAAMLLVSGMAIILATLAGFSFREMRELSGTTYILLTRK